MDNKLVTVMDKIDISKLRADAERIVGVNPYGDPEGWHQYRERTDPEVILKFVEVVCTGERIAHLLSMPTDSYEEEDMDAFQNALKAFEVGK